MQALKILGIVIAALVVALVVSLGGNYVASQRQSDNLQASLQSFYDIPDPLPLGKPGQLIRTEPMTGFETTAPAAVAYRTLYYSVAPDGTSRVSSGMLFVPRTPQGLVKRPVVAYAHGTSGFGAACAPSRSPATPDSMPWINTMTKNGWVVTATDYVGIGTTGTPYFLVGQSEAQDVVNSVRAAQNFPGSGAGNRYAVMGHSQGGHSALWTGELSAQLAPELKLVGVAASAPAAELAPLVTESWNVSNAWGLGPDVLVSWPDVYPEANLNAVTTAEGKDQYQEVAYECVTTSLVGGQVKTAFGSLPFSANPVTTPGWRQAIAAQTPAPLPATLPVMVNQGIADGVVFADTQALLQQKWCEAGSSLQMNWLGRIADGPENSLINHQDTVLVSWPAITTWIQQRFQGQPATPNCTTTPPVAPASP